MQFEHPRETLDREIKLSSLDPKAIHALLSPAVCLGTAERAHTLGGSRLGGHPDLPADVAWPRWDTTHHDASELARAEASAGSSEFAKTRLQALQARGSRAPLPLTFLAQLDLRDLAGLDHGLPLPVDGHLWFFYEQGEFAWGYCPTHRGCFRVLYAPAGTDLSLREPPPDLDTGHILAGAPLECRPAHTLPSWPELEPEKSEGYAAMIDALAGDTAEHQVGGHPDQIQGDMQRACALVTQGVYLGEPPDLSQDELDHLAREARDWKLLLQLGSDDDLGWMWGDCGNLYFWMRESDIAAGNWEQAWFQLQCG
ncbi:MAG: YwqG family protein [Sandaracinaceae bacterium]